MKDYYTILGVSKGAGDEDIKKAYRKLAHEHHPDKPGGNEAKFKEINEAYQVLSNKEKRAQYDRFGQVFEGGTAPGAGGGAWNPFGEGFSSWGFGGNAEDIEDIFGDIFGQFGGGRRKARTRGADIEIAIQITLEDAFRGIQRDIQFKTNVACPVCGGLGYDKEKGAKKCTTCGGKGEVRVERRTILGNFSQVKACDDCGGSGEIPNAKCKNCGGEGRIFSTKTVSLNIAPGIEDGQVIKVAGGGEAGQKGNASGDLYVIIKVAPSATYVRKKNDLSATKNITLSDALSGREIPMTDVGGEKFTVKIPPGFSLNEKMTVPKRGMPKFGGGGRGDLFITFNLVLPKHLSAKAKKLLEDLEHELD